MTVGEVIRKGKKMLEKVTDAPLLEAEVLFSFVSGKSREYLIAREESVADSDAAERFFNLVMKRAKGVPLPYLLHYRDFMGLRFFVDENVLIPRQETETLVEEALKIANGNRVKVLDIGTGSGCILISFLYYNKYSYGTGIDISEKAVEVAGKNARLNGVEGRLKFIVADFSAFNPSEKFDLVLSNPPYVRENELAQVPFEPEVALNGGEDGMKFYPEIAEKAHSFLNPGGVFIAEIDYRNSDKVACIFEQAGFKNVRRVKDLTGRERFVEGVK